MGRFRFFNTRIDMADIVQQNENGFDRIAPLYDLLAKWIFGESIVAAQKEFLPAIRPNAKVLIIGGGSGRVLEELIKIQPSIRVIYVEASFKMLELARKRLISFPNVQVEFIHGTETYLAGQGLFDVIITQFFLDLFKENRLKEVFGILDQQLISGGKWIFADFDWQSARHPRFAKWFIRLMYLFFQIVCGISGRRLPDFSPLFENANYELLEEQKYWGKMIVSRLYQKG